MLFLYPSSGDSAVFQRQLFADDIVALELEAAMVHPVHKVPAYFFRIVLRESGCMVGKINLRDGSNEHIELYAGHIGYKVELEHRGHGYAARALRLILPAARKLQIDPLWITCDPDNVASCRTCEHAGAELIEIVDVPADCIISRSGHPKKCRYRLFTAR